MGRAARRSESARYGCGERWVNVPDVVSRHITNDEIRLVVSSETFGAIRVQGDARNLRSNTLSPMAPC